MIKIINVSFPRSGHHLLVNVLLKYFSGNMDYPETSGEKAKSLCFDVLSAGELHYCEFYNHCRKIPCNDARTNFQKSHDFDSKLPISSDFFYIILYRHPLESIVSHYNYHQNSNFSYLLEGNINFGKNGWIDFANKNIVFWKNFVKKWVIGNRSNNCLFISYDEMIDFPLISFVNIIKFINPNSKVNLGLLRVAIQKTNIIRRYDVKQFKYFDESFFADLERKAKEEIELLDLNLKFN